jgi:transcription-repair coupling factor (superfamily II helicase)
MTTDPLQTVLRDLAEAVRPALRAHRRLSAPPMPGSAEALLGWALAQVAAEPVVWVCDGAATLETRHRDFASLAPSEADRDQHLLFFPDWEALPGTDREEDPEAAGHRLATLRALAAETGAPEARRSGALIVVTCVQALMQRSPVPAALAASTVTLTTGREAPLEGVVAALVRAGYRHAPEVDRKGALCVKGGLLDVWPVTETWPLRIEWFGSEVDSIRSFDPADQRSRRRLNTAAIAPRSEWAQLDAADGSVAAGAAGGMADYLSAGALLVWADPAGIEEHGRMLEEAAAEGRRGQRARTGVEPLDELRARLEALPRVRHLTLGATGDEGGAALPLDFAPAPRVVQIPGDALQPDAVERQRGQVIDEALARAAGDWRVVFSFDAPGSLEHYRPRLTAAGAGGERPGPALRLGALSGGFSSVALRALVMAEADLTGLAKRLASRYMPGGGRPSAVARDAGARLLSLAGLEAGDLVVHGEHGIGRYLGLSEIEFNGQTQEVVTVEYDEGAKLHVPVAQVHLLSRYVGVSKRAPALHRLGGRRWKAEKEEAGQAVMDLAAALLETQAQRAALQGHAFPADTPWQHDFEAAFPYRETPDQERAIAEVKADLESTRPMDRLICGDAGYGKTEVAMRAAFKVVSHGYQVAVLVPTTVLAQQHDETFRERMAAYPFRIEMLSRFCSQAERVRILNGLEAGTIDIVIGTHALIQPSIRLRKLGLVVVDEEQRFGVRHKEQLKQIRRLVDVLTLTATPIPRTLYMSLTGARDMSVIQTPPRERVAIETTAVRASDEVIRRAILRELSREGQVFYLHNRVMTIETVRERLQRLVPEARFAVAHGQMPASQLARVMHRFVEGEFDVLVCTTIIESGVDIPRANTILIDRADRFGIADLYQLRGRVGRSSHKAYACLLLPASGTVDAEARTRIGALRKYSSLSAGFNLALRDLEIRGAGNLLGPQQSGYIAAMGFGLYCQLLRQSIARLKGEPPPRVIDVDVRLDFVELSPRGAAAATAAAIPYDYVDEEALRIGIYGKLVRCADGHDVEALREELRDRFGPPPPPVERLLKMALIRVAAAAKDIRSVEATGDCVRLTREGDFIMPGRRFPRLTAASPDRRLDELIRIIERV